MFLPYVRDQFSHPSRTMGRIAALYVLIFTLFRGKNARERK
jgi:hypothetical protein